MSPSDGLGKNHAKTSVVFYWSILEFGMDALAHEELWFCQTICRLSQCNVSEGGVTQLAKLVLEQFFCHGHDIMRAGVMLTLHGGDNVRLYCKVGMIVADEPALKEIMACTSV